MKKRIFVFLLSFCLLISFNMTLFAAEKSNVTLVPGISHSFLIDNDDILWGWGLNGITDYAFLGDGTTIPRSIPIKIDDNVKSVTAGNEYTFIIKNDNSLWGAGKHLSGLLNQGESEYQLTPIKIMDNVEKIAVSDGMETINENGALILKTDGSLWVAGWDGATVQSKPKQIMEDVQDVFAGLNNFQAITKDGSLFVWGDAYDRLGMDSEKDKSVPVKVMDDVEYSTIGLYITYVLKKDGTIWGFGYNMYGRLQETNNDTLSVDSMELISTPVQIADDALPQMGEYSGNLYYVKKDNSLWLIESKIVYTDITYEATHSNHFEKLMDDVRYLGVNSSGHIFIVQNDGTIWAQGMDNSYTQLGDGTADRKFSPINISRISDANDAIDTIINAMFLIPDIYHGEYTQIDIDNFLRYVEEGISVYATTNTSSEIIDKKLIENQKSKINELNAELAYYFVMGGLQYYREIEENVAVNIDNDFSVSIDPSVLEVDIDNINIRGNDFGVIVNLESLEKELSQGKPLEIIAETLSENVIKVELDRDNLNNPIKVAVPIKGDMMPSRLYVEDEAKNIVPCLFNSASGKLEFKISSSGTYTVKKNLTNLMDIYDCDLGMQLAINFLTLKGIMPKTGEQTFSPNEPITRAEAVDIITKALGIFDSSAKSEFKDVPQDHKYSASIASAKNAAIINGMSKDYFEPDSNIQMSQFAAICANVLNLRFNYESLEYPEIYSELFSDSESIPEWAEEYIAMAMRDGIFGTDVYDYFNSNGDLTRGEFAKLFYRLYKLSW